MNKHGWKYKRLKDISKMICDGDWIESKDQSSEGIRLIQTGNIGSGIFKDKDNKARFISEETFDRLNCTEIFPGDVLVSRLPDPIGRSCILPKLDGRMVTAVDCSIVRLSDECLPKYYVHYTQSNRYSTDILNFTTGSTRKRISRKNLESLLIPIPSKETQLSIVKELDVLNETIAILKKQVSDLDKLIHSVFYNMFGDPITNTKKWKSKKMGDICTITSSKRIFANEYCTEGVPFYRGKEITELSKGLPISIELYISKDRYNSIKKDFGIPSKGDILITAVGTIGNIWVIDNDNPFYFKDGNIIWLKNITGFDSIFFRKLLTLLIAEKKYEMAQGCAYNALTIVNLKKMGVLVPPFSLQQSFAQKVVSIEETKKHLNTQIAEMQTLLAARMQYWFD